MAVKNWIPGVLSESVDGRGVPITAIASPGNAIFTATSISGQLTQAGLYVVNTNVDSVDLNLQWGSLADKDRIIVTVRSNQGLSLEVPQLRLGGGLIARGYASITNSLSIFGSTETYIETQANTWKPAFLSESVNGGGILIDSIAAPGRLLHATSSASNKFDQLRLYAVSRHTDSVTGTIVWGGNTWSDRIPFVLKAKTGLSLELPSLRLRAGLTVSAYCSIANVMSIFGSVDTYTAP